MTPSDFDRRLAAIPFDKDSKKREPHAVQQLCAEAIYAISLNGDTASRHLAQRILKANG